MNDFDASINEVATLWAIPDLAARVNIAYSTRLRRSLGRAVPATGRIRLHPGLQHADPQLLDEVLVHELAHIAAYLLYGPGRRPHGHEWRRLVEQAGRTARVRIDVDLPPATPARRRTKRQCARRAERYPTPTLDRWRSVARHVAANLGLLSILLLCLLPHGSQAAPQASPDTLIHNARIIDGTGKVLEGSSLTTTGEDPPRALLRTPQRGAAARWLGACSITAFRDP